MRGSDLDRDPQSPQPGVWKEFLGHIEEEEVGLSLSVFLAGKDKVQGGQGGWSLQGKVPEGTAL